MPAVEEEEEGTKRALLSPLKRKVEEVQGGERGTKRAMVSPLKRKTGGIIEMWTTDESYTSPVKEAKILETLDLADDLNLDEEKVKTTEEKKEKEVPKSSVDSSFSSSVHASDLLERSTDPDIEIEEVELGDESVGASDESGDKVTSSQTGRQRFSKTGEQEEAEESQLISKDMRVKDDGDREGDHEGLKAKTAESDNDLKLDWTAEERKASIKSINSNHDEQASAKENAKTSQGHGVEVINLGQESTGFGKGRKFPVEDRKVPVEVVELDSEEEMDEETVHHSTGGVTVRYNCL